MTEKVSFWEQQHHFFSDATPNDIKKLVEQGADPHEQRPYGSVIGEFCAHENVEAVRCLIKDYKVLPPLDNAVKEQSDDQIPRIRRKSLLLDCIINFNTTVAGLRYLEIAKLLLSTGADRLFNSPLERKYPSLLYGFNEYDKNRDFTPIEKLLLEYEYPLINCENKIRVFGSSTLLKALDRQKANILAVQEWFKEHTPYPQKEEFLTPLPDHEEPAIVTIIRTGRENMMKAFQPLEKWTKNKNRADLRKIFSVVPRTDFFTQRVMMLEDALVLENRKQIRIKMEKANEEEMEIKAKEEDKPVAARLTIAQKRQALSEILKSIDSPELKQQIDDSVRKRWGWKPRSKRSR